jgi:hypothetical protein
MQLDNGNLKIIPPDGSSKISLGKSQFGGTVFPIELDYDVAGQAVIRVSQRGNTADSGDLWLNKSRGTEDSPTPVQGGDHIGQIAYTGQTTDIVATGYARTARIVAGVDEVSGKPLHLTSAPGYLQFQTTKSGSGLGVYAGEMILSQEGNLGIGSNTSFSGVPYAGKINARLHVDGTAILGSGASDFVHVSGALTASAPARLEGVVTATGISAGTVADSDSYLGLNASNEIIKTATPGGGGNNQFAITTGQLRVTYTTQDYMYMRHEGNQGGSSNDFLYTSMYLATPVPEPGSTVTWTGGNEDVVRYFSQGVIPVSASLVSASFAFWMDGTPVMTSLRVGMLKCSDYGNESGIAEATDTILTTMYYKEITKANNSVFKTSFACTGAALSVDPGDLVGFAFTARGGNANTVGRFIGTMLFETT